MKIAILSTGNLDDMKGVMNFVHQKVKSFQSLKQTDLQVDCYLLLTYYVGLLSLIRRNAGEPRYEHGQVIIKDKVAYNILVREQGFCGLVSSFLFRKFVPSSTISRFAKTLSRYDVISAHQLPCQYIAVKIKEMNGIPCILTWHGSDINVSPRHSQRLFLVTKYVMEHADMNYFVSKGLMNASGYISSDAEKDVIYTGPSDNFYKYDISHRLELRKKFNVQDKKVVAFAGNVVPIKNVMVLPSVFYHLSRKLINENISYWIIGNGELEQPLKNKLEELRLPFRMFGKVEPSIMPDLMNCIDILVLPSLNEGFSLSVLEARKSGSYAVASRVGGLPESAGEENCFPLDEYFVERITNRMVDILSGNVKYEPLPEEYSWDSAVMKEISCCERILKIHTL